MARKYKRDKNGRFAGGSGSSSSRSSSSKKKSSSASGKRSTPKKGSTQVRAAKKQQANPSGQRLYKTKQAANRVGKSVGKFAKENPRLVTTAVVYGGLHAGAAMNRVKIARGLKEASKAFQAAQRYAQRKASDKRGLGGRPGANLRKRRRNLRGAYNIRSM